MLEFQNDCWNDSDHARIINYSSKELWRFIQRFGTVHNQQQVVENLTGLNANQIQTLSNIHFLLTKEVSNFISIIAPNIIKRLSKTSYTKVKTEKGKIKGTVNWPRTALIQTVTRDPSIFVCKQNTNIFDLIQNKVLLYCIKYIYQTGQLLLSKGFKTSENSSLELVGSDNVKWLTQIQDIILKSQGLLKKPLFREISDLHDINEKLIQSTKLSRGENYYKVAQLSELIMRQKNNPLKFLYERFSKQILRPLSKDTLYEIAVLFRVIECLKGNGWKETDVSLIGEKQDTISILSKGNFKIRIFYQKLPNEFAQNSVYMNLMNDYNLGIQNRRPDIILEWIVKEKTKKYTIIEVKRSKNKGYITDGLYKLLGYTKDFQLPLENTKKGMGILVAWQINDFPKAVENEVSLSDWDNLVYSIFKLEEQIFTHFNNAIY